MSVLNTALAFASRGHAVIPLHWPIKRNGKVICSCGKAECTAPAKHPLGRAPDGAPLAINGILSATTESAIVKLWFSIRAPEANLGVRTDNLLVLDIDDRHDGEESLRRLEESHQPLPQTWRSITGGGGQHILFAKPENVDIASWAHPTAPLGPGIDGRSRGGYIVAPSSIHISGRPYAWNVDFHPADVPLSLPPQWLIDILAPPRPKAVERSATARHASEWVKICSQEVREYRDLIAARLAGRLIRYHDPDAVLGLMECWNSVRCIPPLDTQELTAIVTRIAANEARRIGGAHA